MDKRTIITFSEKANELLVPAWKDFVANYRAVNFSKKTTYDASKSLAEKQALVDSMIENEVLLCAGINTEGFASQAANVTNPVYQWAKFAVVNRLIDMANIVDADIYIMSHVHQPAIVRNSFYRTNMGNSSVAKVDKLFVNTSAALDWGGYGEHALFRPASLKTPLIILNGRKHQAEALL